LLGEVLRAGAGERRTKIYKNQHSTDGSLLAAAIWYKKRNVLERWRVLNCTTTSIIVLEIKRVHKRVL
jgi:hypothetical protein